ncbi:MULTISPECIES: YdcF family protein [unclassified Moorena]|uniref:YdcF family protein n=1 Tax=unclassified Moorena TaxID=2683338 RepID=UPI0013BB5A16|nr:MULTISPECIES: YdcF family protein [unclassified Moorena]NEP32959.1 YdcF family protein [Moorena sp. SIO3B2]NEQ06753.1 YdcF family protein [Moorena sp. SIO4E2]NES46207.1 YdcF family protein [Moorena sp. SIO2C4]
MSFPIAKIRLNKLWLVLLPMGLFFLSIIPLRLAIARHQAPEPQAILVLGGNKDRFKFTAQFSQSHPELDIWVSDYPSNFEHNRQIFRKVGISDQRIHYDFCPTDTVTNFTCTVNYFYRQDIQHIYLVTSDYHMVRSRAIATFVLGSRGIAITPVTVPSKGYPKESKIRVIRDCIRSLLWIVTGKSGASLNPDIKS